MKTPGRVVDSYFLSLMKEEIISLPFLMPEVLEKIYYPFPGERFGQGRNYFCFGSSLPSVKVGSSPSVEVRVSLLLYLK